MSTAGGAARRLRRTPTIRLDELIVVILIGITATALVLIVLHQLDKRS